MVKEMLLMNENRKFTFKNEVIEIVFYYYKCEDSGEQFTTTNLDEINQNQLYYEYNKLKFKNG